ncbi:MAG: altronate hydrolase [Cyclobacteriaceae bacterium]|nr:MAG: altronate hydrolase [Cyclobacteriaceae bacterium]
MSSKFLKIHPDDNVCVALTDLRAGEMVSENGYSFALAEDIPAKHKFTTTPLNAQDEVRMYGVLVGRAIKPIAQGAAITTQNVKHQSAGYSGKKKTAPWTPPDISRWKNRTFMGYHRPDGQVGVANYWLVIPLVFCENRNVAVMKQAFEEALGYGKKNQYKDYVAYLADMYRANRFEQAKPVFFEKNRPLNQNVLFKNIDGIKFLTHEGGCGGTRADAEALCALLAGYIHNPNVAGATVLSLGCQNAQVEILEKKIHALNSNFSKPLVILEQQKEGKEQDLISRSIYETFTGLAKANELERKPAPLSKLVVGLECGGSDGFSGISANPAVGHAADLIVALGGSAILSEFPELCGVEQELIDRCTNEVTANRFVELMRAYANRAAAAGSGFDMNPSPGNIRDGLITDAMKSAGAAKKGGTSPITDVLDYGEYVKLPGLNLLCTPGNDVESTTAMAGAGATIILFTTGLGTPTGNPIAPVVKISSNSKLAGRMPDIIDINAGGIIEGTKTIAETGEEILEFIIRLASGEIKTRAMELQQDDFIPWKRGISL